MERFVYQLYIDQKTVAVAASVYKSAANLQQIAFIKKDNLAYNHELDQLEFNPLKDLVQSCLNELKKKINVSEIKTVYLSYGFDCFKTSNQTANEQNNFTNLSTNQSFEFNNLINVKHQINYTLVDYGLSYQEYNKTSNNQLTSIFSPNEINQKTYLSGYYIKNDDYHTLCQVFQSLKITIARFHVSQAHLLTNTLISQQDDFNKVCNQNQINVCLDFNKVNNRLRIYSNNSLVLDQIEPNSELFNMHKLIQSIVEELQISKQTINDYFENKTYDCNPIIKYVLNQKDIFSVTEMSSETINKLIVNQLNQYLKTLFNQQASVFKHYLKHYKLKFHFSSKLYNFNMILKEAINNDELVKLNSNIKYTVFELQNIFIADHFKDKYELKMQYDLINIKLSEDSYNLENITFLHQQLQNSNSKEINMNN